MLENNLFFKKSIRTSLFFGIIILLTLLLSSCGNYIPQPKAADYHKGTWGLEIDFLEHAPPDELYEESPFNINIYVENRGAFDVIRDFYGILSISFDPFYIDSSGLKDAENIEIKKDSLVFKGIQLYGKSRYYPLGSDVYLNMIGFKTKEVTGQREKPSAQIFASLCYPYITTLSNLVCVDLNLLGQNLRRQTCVQEDLMLTDQGAPLAVTLVEVENQPAGSDVVRPVFTIHVDNKGTGNVLSPVETSMDFERVCSFQDLYREDFNTVNIEAYLSSSKQLECNPNPFKLFGNKGFTRCKLRDEDLTVAHQNYETTLTINLSYVYLTSMSKDVDIKRIDVYGDLTSPNDRVMPYEVQEGVTRCEYCAGHGGGGAGSIPCQPPTAKYPIQYQTGFDCQCGKDTCDKLYPKGLCVPFANFCPGASYCCLPECKSSEVRLGDGKCYKKCSKCLKPTKECACGTDETSYIKIGVDEYCCPKYQSVHSEQQVCADDCARKESEP